MDDESLRLLLIEDNSVDVLVIRECLAQTERLRIELEHAGQLSLGLALLGDKRFDAALLDLNLPDSSGLKTIDIVHACNPDLPIVVLTGEDGQLALQAMKAGAEDYICKRELEPAALLRSIQYAIERAGRRKADKKLIRSELRYRTLFAESPDGIVLIDPRSCLSVEFNDAACRQLGYSREEFGRLRISDYEVQETPAQICAHIGAILRDGRADFQTQHRGKSGEIRDVLVSAQAITLEGWQLVYAMQRDVSDYRRAMAALSEAEERFNAFISESAYGYAEFDLRGTLMFVNQRLAEILGYSADEMLGRHYRDYVADGSQEQAGADFERAFIQEPRKGRQAYSVRTKSGQTRILAITSVPLHHQEQPSRLLCLCLDVTEQRKLELALGEREQRYRELLAAVTNYTYSVTLEDGMPVSTDHSRGCLSVTGYSPEEYQADPYLWINMVHPDDQETVRQYVAAILGGKRVSAIEHRIIRRDGTIRWLRDTIVPHHDGEELVRYDGLVEDVTERRFAERTLQERELQLVAAQKIQQRLLPTESPRLPGFDIGGKAYAAEFTAGDFFDYLAMPNGTKGFVIGDVLGHGFSSALLMASTSTLVRMLAETHTEVGEILEKVNRFLTKETDDTFITVLLACLDPATRSFVYASGGHTPGYILDASGAVKVRLDSTSMPLAVSAEMQFPVAEPIVLERGNLVLLLTDGIQEAMSPDGKPLGITPVLDVVRTKRAQAADEIVESLHRLVCDFCQSEKPIDDLTAMVIKVET